MMGSQALVGQGKVGGIGQVGSAHPDITLCGGPSNFNTIPRGCYNSLLGCEGVHDGVGSVEADDNLVEVVHGRKWVGGGVER